LTTKKGRQIFWPCRKIGIFSAGIENFCDRIHSVILCYSKSRLKTFMLRNMIYHNGQNGILFLLTVKFPSINS